MDSNSWTGNARRLEVAGLSLRRGGRLIAERIDFALESGAALILTGPNGAGKTSLLRALAGLLRCSGEVRFEGGDPDLTLPEQSHYLGHLDPVKGALTVEEQLRFWIEFADAFSEPGAEGGEFTGKKIQTALRRTGIHHLADFPSAYLSAGQKRRLSLARLLAVRRPVWLADEPTASLDAEGEALFVAMAHDHLAAGGILIAATHAPLAIAPAQELRLGAFLSEVDAGSREENTTTQEPRAAR